MYTNPPVDSYHFQQQPPQQNYQYQTQYDYNQPTMEYGSQQFHNSYQQPQMYQQSYGHFEPPQQYQHQQLQQHSQPPQSFNTGEGETWNISQNKASYVVSISKCTTENELGTDVDVAN
jgi:hypothetical protein